MAEWVRTTSERRLLAGFVLALGVLIAIGAVAFTITNRLIDNSRSVAHTQEVITAVQSTLSTIKDAETGQRGYLITGDESYLTLYDTATRNISTEILQLTLLTQDNHAQQQRIATLQTQLAGRLDNLQQAIAARRTNGFVAAQQTVLTNGGQQTMTQIRDTAAAIEQEERDLLARRQADTEISSQQTTQTLLVLTILDVALLGLVYYLIRQDVATRKRAEAARLRATLSSIGDAVIATDAAGRITFMNGVAEALTGWTQATAEGQVLDAVFRIVDEVTHAPMASPAGRVLAESTVVGLTNHTCLLARDGTERPIDDSAAPILDTAGQLIGVVLVFRDISQRRQAEQERVALLAAAQQALQIRDGFLSLAAHELKTPLTSLVAAAQLMQRRAEREGSLNERDQHALNIVIGQADRLSRMVLSLLDLSRIETGQLSIVPARIDLGALARRIVEEVQPTLERHTLHLQAPAEPVIVEGDALRLEQVMQNLIQNAVKYSPKGGPVTMRVAPETGGAAIAVSDQGIGIPPAALTRLFERFFRASNVAGQHISGLGIGLYVVKEIVQLHGGTVEVQSTEGHGSTFTVHLPGVYRRPDHPVPRRDPVRAGGATKNGP